MLKTFKNAVFEIKVTWGLHILCELNVGYQWICTVYGYRVTEKWVYKYAKVGIFNSKIFTELFRSMFYRLNTSLYIGLQLIDQL